MQSFAVWFDCQVYVFNEAVVQEGICPSLVGLFADVAATQDNIVSVVVLQILNVIAWRKYMKTRLFNCPFCQFSLVSAQWFSSFQTLIDLVYVQSEV